MLIGWKSGGIPNAASNSGSPALMAAWLALASRTRRSPRWAGVSSAGGLSNRVRNARTSASSASTRCSSSSGVAVMSPPLRERGLYAPWPTKYN